MSETQQYYLVCPRGIKYDTVAYYDDYNACGFSGKVAGVNTDHTTWVTWAVDDKDIDMRCDTHHLPPLKIYRIAGYWSKTIKEIFESEFLLNSWTGYWTRRVLHPKSLHAQWITT